MNTIYYYTMKSSVISMIGKSGLRFFRVLLLSVLFLTQSSLYAASITKEEAMAYATEYLAKSGRSLAEDAENMSENDLFYVFAHKGKGFIVVGKDKALTPHVLLSVTDIDYTQPEKPLFIQNCMDALPSVINGVLSSTSLRSGAGETSQRTNVGPLIKTSWHQGYPYNSMVDGMPTGCGATALAQLMYYHKYPDTCAGTGSYEQGSIFYDELPSVKFDYSKMKERYDSTETADEVAKLMKYCGYAMKTEYEKDGSGSDNDGMLNALINVFHFSLDTKLISAERYNWDKWSNAIYDELKAGRPVILGGYESRFQGGHWFICDGYIDNMFHYNMGWYDLEAYDGLAVYSDNRDAIIGIQPPKYVKCGGYTFEVSQMNLHSTYCPLQTSYVDFKLRNVGTERYFGNIFMESNMYVNTSGPVKINGWVRNGDPAFAIEPGESVELTYGISSLDTCDVWAKFKTSDNHELGEVKYHVGGYTNSADSIVCKIGFKDWSYYDEDEGIYYLNHGTNVADIHFENKGDVPFRGVVQVLNTSNSGIDTLTYDGDYVIEVLPHTTDTTRYIFDFSENVTNALMRIGIIPVFGNVRISSIYSLKMRKLSGLLDMEINDNRITVDVLVVYLNQFHPQSLMTLDASPNCVYVTDRVGYRPDGVNSNFVVNGKAEYMDIYADYNFMTDTDIVADSASFHKSFRQPVVDMPTAMRSGGDEYIWDCMIFPFAPETATLSSGCVPIDSDDILVYALDSHLNAIPVKAIKPHVPYMVGIRSDKAEENVVFRGRNVTIPASVNIEIETDYGSLVSSSVAYSNIDAFSYFSVYKFDATTRSFRIDDGNLFDDQAPFSVCLMNDEFLSEEEYDIVINTGIDDWVSEEEKSVRLYNPLGVSVGTFKVRNGQVEGKLSKGMYVSDGYKHLER